LLPAVALFLAASAPGGETVEVYALASRYPFIRNAPWFEQVAGRHITGVCASLPPDAADQAQERGRMLDLEAAVPELLAALGEG